MPWPSLADIHAPGRPNTECGRAWDAPEPERQSQSASNSTVVATFPSRDVPQGRLPESLVLVDGVSCVSLGFAGQIERGGGRGCDGLIDNRSPRGSAGAS